MGRLRRPRWGRWLLLGCLAVAALAVLLSAAPSPAPRAKGQKPGPPPVPVVGVAARRGDVPVYLTGIGSVVALATVDVRSRVDGQLIRVHFREGQMVEAGDLLAELDPRPFRAQLQLAQGELARDRALRDNSKHDLRRYEDLAALDSIPRQQLDAQRSLVRQNEATVAADKGTVANAQLQLDYSRIEAPVTGRVGLRAVDPGNIVHATDTSGLVIITQLDPISVVFTLPEDSLRQVTSKLDAGAKLPVDALDREMIHVLAEGVVLTVDNQIDPATGTIRVRALFANGRGVLFPNQFVNARVLVDTQRGVTIVPVAAVQRGAQRTFVYVVGADQTARARDVKVGITQGEDVVVTSGLTVGEVVVTEGSTRIRDGSPVAIHSAGATGGGMTAP